MSEEKQSFFDKLKTKYKAMDKKKRRKYLRNIGIGIVIVVAVIIGKCNTANAADTATIVEYVMPFESEGMNFTDETGFSVRLRSNDAELYFEAVGDNERVGAGLIGGDDIKLIAGGAYGTGGWDVYERIELSPDSDNTGGIVSYTHYGWLNKKGDNYLALGVGNFNQDISTPKVIPPTPIDPPIPPKCKRGWGWGDKNHCHDK